MSDFVTWPPVRGLIVGHEYIIRTRDGLQKYPREHKMSYLGTDDNSMGELVFNARPFAGTQHFRASSIVASKDMGNSGGRECPDRYMNRVIKN